MYHNYVVGWAQMKFYINRKIKKPKTCYKEFRSFKHFEASAFQNDLMSVSWDVIKSFDNIEDSWNA